jgi:hypothetical protein
MIKNELLIFLRQEFRVTEKGNWKLSGNSLVE